jgi:hypothetical protein
MDKSKQSYTTQKELIKINKIDSLKQNSIYEEPQKITVFIERTVRNNEAGSLK